MGHDLFREIAITKHPIASTDREIEPGKLPDIYFEKTEVQGRDILLREDIPYEERVKQFKRDLQKLRAAYEPYMQNYLAEEKSLKRISYLKEFLFRYLEEGERFTDRDRKEAAWEKVVIPDYRGPVDEEGKWRGYYKCRFRPNSPVNHKERVILHFQCVDYKAIVYVNGNYVGGHEGFFAPFEFDITDYLEEENELVIECRNDYTILGTGPVLDGDKVYAATGPGFDDPYTGWHHCPPGAGVFGKVSLEVRPCVCIDDIFVRPDTDGHAVEVRIGITNYTGRVEEDYRLHIRLLPKNYTGQEIGGLEPVIHYIGLGKNEYRFVIPVRDYRLWEPETPYLYGAVAELGKDAELVSRHVNTFGMKKFICDESSEPKGKLYFNGRPIVLRGANEMGHLQQCVMTGDFDRLIDDILIAKLCNLNYYRITQRPVQEEIYDYFDMLGMMHQCDFPLFGFLRRNQYAEAIRQVEEMEHLIRTHVSTIMVTFINEPMCIRRTADPTDKYSTRYNIKGHRHLLRDELEAFFAAARKTIYIQNPDRVVKNVEGDYDPPTGEGMPDFHCYTMWYTNHAQPIGRLLKGYLPPVKPGWMTGCGEYGAEGLDNENIILERYPPEWLEKDELGRWYPDKIVRAQTHGTHGDWYREQTTVSDWVKASQKHQAEATKLMTDLYRRRADIINHTAIHLLTDAWPSGWMKTLVGCDRVPKPAYFSYMDALVRLRVNLYTDRRYVYDDEEIGVEAWLLNDTAASRRLVIYAELMDAASKTAYEAYRLAGSVDAAASVCAGIIPVKFGRVKEKTSMRLAASILDENGEVLHSEGLELTVYPRRAPLIRQEVRVTGDRAKAFAADLELNTAEDSRICICSETSPEALEDLGRLAREGGHAVLLLPDEDISLEVLGMELQAKGSKEVFFAGTYMEGTDLYMLYNKDKDYIDFVGRRYIVSDREGEYLAYTYGRNKDKERQKEKLPFAVRYRTGGGSLTVISLLWESRISYNPNLDEFLAGIIAGE